MGGLPILPLAIVMIAGPQIITSFFLALSERWRADSLAFLAGAAVSISAIVTASYLVARRAGSSFGAPHHHHGDHAADWVLLVLLLALMVVVFRNRKRSGPPAWMAKLQGAGPRSSFLLGMALLGVFPSDLMINLGVGLRLSHQGDSLTDALPFIGVTVLLLALPALVVLLFGKRAEQVLPKVRDWMGENSWIISEALLALFVVLQLQKVA